MELLQRLLGETGVTIVSFFSNFGDELIMVAILGAIYWCCNKEFGVFIGTNLMADLIWIPMIKNVALRRRPYFDNPGVKCMRPVDPAADLYDIGAQGYSFPSAHSSNSLTLYGSAALKLKKKGITVVCVILSFLIGLSRVVVGVHYPTDILAGWLLGILIMCVVSYLQRKIRDRRILFLILFLTAIPGWFYCTSDDFYTGFGVMTGFFLAVPFEERFVKFKETRVIWRAILRIAIGIGLFLGLNSLFKLPFSESVLEADNFIAHLIRASRYGVIGFLIIGVYPLSFRLLDRKLEKENA